MGFPEEYGGGGDIGASIAAFETLALGDLSVLVKVGVQFGLFGGAILQLGTKHHHDAYLADLVSGRTMGCFAMTESGHGSNVQALGTETPVIDIKNAVPAYAVDVVALSFSSAITQNAALAGLSELRGLLPEGVEVWGGGGALARARKPPEGVLLLRSFDDMRYALERWRIERAQP